LYLLKALNGGFFLHLDGNRTDLNPWVSFETGILNDGEF